MSCPSSIWCWDLNPRPLEHESSPITTRPGLPPYEQVLNFNIFYKQLYPACFAIEKAMPASFFFIFVFLIIYSKYVHYIIWLMTGSEPRISDTESDRSANCAQTLPYETQSYLPVK